MSNIIIPPGWKMRERDATPEAIYWNRRAFVKSLGLGAAAVGLRACTPGRPSQEANGASQPGGPLDTIPVTPTRDLYPAARSDAYVLDREVTDRIAAATHNNFYEFTTDTAAVWKETGPFVGRPWSLEIAGEVDNPGVHDLADLEREFGLEERLYRLRCVEAWAMAVPWTGFPLAKLIRKAQPLSGARYVRFVSFNRPEQAVGQRTQHWYPWPYFEGLRMDEALNDLSFLVTGVYGEPLPKQHGAPLRLAVPWKYGFKSPKSIVRIELVRDEPPTFWNELAPTEYGFYSTVNPDVPHPRWSQASETMLGTGERVPTLLFNGYGDSVGEMYDPRLLDGIS
jgi:methionine sulfoxide reductase catalytic subunit